MSPSERDELLLNIVTILKEQQPSCLNEEEQRWVKMAIQKEAQSIELRQAIIEKTLAGLVWAGLVAFGYILLEWARAHGFKG
jgi:hypothetical protein